MRTPSRSGDDERHARHAGDLGGDRVHQHGARIGGGAARRIEADRVDRRPAQAEVDAEGVAIAVVLRQLPAVESFDAVAGEAECRVRVRRDGRLGRVELGVGDTEPLGGQRDAVEARGVLDQRCVTAAAHIIDDDADRRLDILGDLALGRKQGREAALKVGIGPREPRRHPRSRAPSGSSLR